MKIINNILKINMCFYTIAWSENVCLFKKKKDEMKQLKVENHLSFNLKIRLECQNALIIISSTTYLKS